MAVPAGAGRPILNKKTTRQRPHIIRDWMATNDERRATGKKLSYIRIWNVINIRTPFTKTRKIIITRIRIYIGCATH